MKYFLMVMISIWALPLFAKTDTQLKDQLESLQLPKNALGGFVSKEKLYSVQSRHVSLKRRFEISLAGLEQFSDTGFISNREVALGTRYYINSKWSVGGSYSYAFNKLTETTNDFFALEGMLPKVSYTKSRFDITARYLLFYGKFRLSMDKILYFDHFISLGPSLNILDTGNHAGVAADTGIMFWLGQNWNVLFGIKNYSFFKNNLETSEREFINQAKIYLSAGFLFGGL